MSLPSGETALVEDSLAGIKAASAGGFALVVAVDRAGIAQELHAAGADLVVADLTCLVEGAEKT